MPSSTTSRRAPTSSSLLVVHHGLGPRLEARGGRRAVGSARWEPRAARAEPSAEPPAAELPSSRAASMPNVRRENAIRLTRRGSCQTFAGGTQGPIGGSATLRRRLVRHPTGPDFARIRARDRRNRRVPTSASATDWQVAARIALCARGVNDWQESRARPGPGPERAPKSGDLRAALMRPNRPPVVADQPRPRRTRCRSCP